MTKVFVAITGVYEDTWPSGVYDSVERAIAAFHKPGMVWREVVQERSDRVTVSWENDRDWQEAVRIEEMELVDSGPERAPDIVQTIDYATDTSKVITTEKPFEAVP